MKNIEIIKKGQSYKYNFFCGDIKKISKIYDMPEATFIIAKTGDENELFWGVKKLETFRDNLERIVSENDSFIFRYAGHLDDLIEKKKIIEKWGYKSKNTHLGYFHDDITINMNYKDLKINMTTKLDENIIPLRKEEINDFMKLDEKLFNSFNNTEEELNKAIDEDLIMIFKKESHIKGFIIIKIYGSNSNSCFIRNVGVSAEERGKGIGESLLITGLNKAAEMGVKKSMLWVDIDNKPARNLYEKLGYRLNKNEVEVVFEV